MNTAAPQFFVVLYNEAHIFDTLGPFASRVDADAVAADEVKAGFLVKVRDSDGNTLSTQNPAPPPKKLRGFAANPELARTAGRKGGLNVPADKRSFSANRELAKAAGKKGGHAVPAEKRSFAVNPQLAQAAGRKIRSSTDEA